jgi:hypothetical protein
MSLPRNVRTKTPRSVSLRGPHHFAQPLTPTPPPVTIVAIADEPSELSEPSTPRALSLWHRYRARLGLGLLALSCAASAIAWRQTMHDFSLTEAADLARAALIRDAKATPAPRVQAQPSPATSSAPTALPVGWPRADTTPPPKTGWIVKYDGHVPLEGGVLVMPKSFKPDTDEFDLVIHFHGDVQIVKQSVEHAKLDAALAIINVGVRSAPYRQAYQVPGAYEALVKQIHAGLQRRGLRAPKLRRLALTSWSAGYGAVESILEHRTSPRAEHDALDAIIALDGVHAGFVDGDPARISERTVRAFLGACRAAKRDQLMVSLTHSAIDPGLYAGTRRTQEYLLSQMGVALAVEPMLPLPPHVTLPGARGAVASGRDQKMVPTSDTRVGSLRVQGFEGNTRKHHASHLTQMAAVALGDLAARWKKPATAPKQ